MNPLKTKEFRKINREAFFRYFFFSYLLIDTRGKQFFRTLSTTKIRQMSRRKTKKETAEKK